MSENGYFDDLDDSSDLNPLETEKFAESEQDKDLLGDNDNFDAFNEETFDCALEGDWEAEHDKLIELEQNENDLNNTLTKYENADDEDDNEYKDDDDYMNGYNQSGSNIRLDTNTIKQLNSKNNLITHQSSNISLNNNNNNNNNNINSSNIKMQQDNNRNLIEEQIKILTQLQLQQQQLKNHQILQQAQKQYQQQQINSAMFLAAINARNNQMQQQQQQQQNLIQKQQHHQQQYNIMQNNNTASNIIANEPNRKTPINFNSNLNMMPPQLNDKENNMNSYLNQAPNLISQQSFKNIPSTNENDSIKLKNLLEKINQINLNTNTNSNTNNNRPVMPIHSMSNDQINNRRESPVLKQPIDKSSNSIIHSILQSQTGPPTSVPAYLPKLPPTKVKTLEEIENELLSQPQSTKSPVGHNYSRNSPSDIQHQQQQHDIKNQMRLQQHQQLSHSSQQQPDVTKFFPLMNNNSNNSNSPNMHSPIDNIEKQKKILEALALHQYQQQILKFQQQQSQSQVNQLLNQPSNNNQIEQQLQQQLLMIQQQLIPVQLNINAMLPPNFPTLSPQQKQLILNQIQRNLQATLLQQQLLQQQQQNGQMQRLEDQLKSNNNNNSINDLNNNNGRNMNNNNRHQQQHQQQNNQIRNDKDRKKQPNNMRNSNSNNNSFNNGNNNNNNSNNNGNNINTTSGDKLAGMMTDKEKNWVVNVQMLQLQIDDPYRYDYYYTAWMLKKKQFSMKNTNSAGLKTSVLQLMNNNKDPKNYRPLTFENSLGKVTMSNFHHPRALIDLNRDSEHTDSSIVTHIDGLDDEDDEKQKEVKNKDTILLEIEKIYQVLLSIDEIEHSILKAPEEIRNQLFQERRGKVDKLALMLCTENFPHYLFVEKGKRLIAKSIPIFNLSQAKLILGFFMQYIYIISKNNIALDEVYSHISYAIDTQKFTDLVEIVNQFVHLYSRQPVSVFHTIFSNKFSLTFLLKFMSKSELVNQDDYDNDIKTIWSCYLNLILAGLSLIQPLSVKADGSLWNISEINQLNIKAVLDNFSVDADLWSKNELKLKELFSLI